MKTKITFLSIVLFTFTIFLNSCSKNDKSNAENKKINDNWEIIVNNGKGINVKKYSLPLTTKITDKYITMNKTLDPEFEGLIKDDINFAYQMENENLKIDSIGKFYDYDVFYVSNIHIMHRSLMLRDVNGNYRVLYLENEHFGSPYKGTIFYSEYSSKVLSTQDLAFEIKPTIYIENDKPMIFLKSYAGGQKVYYDRYVWTYDTKAKVPKLMKN